MHAYCYRGGQIHFGPAVPEGALPVAEGGLRQLVDTIESTARLARDNDTWLVPGVPEAASDDAAREAVAAYRRWINPESLTR
ncbi:hypothetical protein [Endothiovibrio diazotrophicus]